MSTVVPIEGELTVFAVHALKERLLAAMTSDAQVLVDVSEVSEVDGAGVQLLLAMRREAQERRLDWRITPPPPVLSEALHLIDPGAAFALTHSTQEAAV